MINSVILSDVRNQLEKLGFDGVVDLSLKECNDNCLILSFCNGNKSYDVRFYEDDKICFIDNYVEMAKYGITAYKYMVENNIVVYENDLFCKEFSLSDLVDEEIIVNLAKFYKKLHNIRLSDIRSNCYFKKNNVGEIINHFRLNNNECLTYLYNNASNIELKINRLDKCLLSNGFSLEHLVILEGSKEIYLKDLDVVEMGNRCMDLNALFDVLNKEGKDKFLSVYGSVKADERILSKVENVVKELYLATKEKEFPSWVKNSFLLIEQKSFLLDVKCLVEWY